MDNGSTIGMDRFGMEHVLPDDRRVATVLRLLELGYAERMVLSHDAAIDSHVTPPAWRAREAPNWHMATISKRILPMLRAGGASEADLEQMLVAQPSSAARAVAVKAALLVEPGRIDVDDVPSPTPGPDEVRIAVVGVGLCGSDLSVFRGVWDAPDVPVDHGPRGLRHHRSGRSGGARRRGSARSSSSSRTSSAAHVNPVAADGRQRARNASRSA